MIRRSGTQSANADRLMSRAIGQQSQSPHDQVLVGLSSRRAEPAGYMRMRLRYLAVSRLLPSPLLTAPGAATSTCARDANCNVFRFPLIERPLPISDHIVGEVGQRVLQSDSATFAPYDRDAEPAPGAFWVLHKIGLWRVRRRSLASIGCRVRARKALVNPMRYPG